jgi:hypothetical protein
MRKEVNWGRWLTIGLVVTATGLAVFAVATSEWLIALMAILIGLASGRDLREGRT